jgi:putative ubiquitin-RnfH superfamily antitoxin RatB of RatAB toxin-antitoxin module
VDLVIDEGKPRAIEESEVQKYAKDIGAVGVFETSAKKNLQVRESNRIESNRIESNRIESNRIQQLKNQKRKRERTIHISHNNNHPFFC